MLNIDQLQHDLMVCLLGHQIWAPNSGKSLSNLIVVVKLSLLSFLILYKIIGDLRICIYCQSRGELVFTQKGAGMTEGQSTRKSCYLM